jgi:tetratricopeptide (TPR) repeat protein
MRLWYLFKLGGFLRANPNEALATAQKIVLLGAAAYIIFSLYSIGSTLRVFAAGDRASALVRTMHPDGLVADRIVVEYTLPGGQEPTVVYVQSAINRLVYRPGTRIPVVFDADNPAQTTYIATFWGAWANHWVRILISGGLIAATWFLIRAGRRYNAQSLQSHPEADIRELRGNTLVERGDLAGAIGEYTASLAIVPSPRIFVRRADAYVQLGRQRAARRDYRRAIRWYEDMRRQHDVAVVRQRLDTLG